MKLHYGLNDFDAKKSVVTIGTFDGVHKGHQQVIARLQEIAKKHGGETVIFTFHTHPRLVTSPAESNLRLLTTLQEKIELFNRYGIDHLVIYPFDKNFSELSYSEFVEEIIVNLMRTHCLVVGYDHKFGKNREGDFDYLQKCASKFNFEVEKLEVLTIEKDSVSSTKIRQALESGEIEKANRYLGYYFTLHGTVVTGKQVGRKLGFPTANIEASDKHKIIPGYGVYAVEVKINNTKYNGMLNIGTRPTFNNNADNRSIEVNIFDFEEDVYGKEITIEFIGKIRDEQRFESIEGLINQLKTDKKIAQEILKK